MRAKVYGVVGFEREFAVKQFNAALIDDAKAQALSAAARSYGTLDHPRIAKLTEYGVAQGRTFAAVELVSGLHAGALISDGRLSNSQLPAGGVLALLTQAARALGYAHGRGLLHLGLAPTNLLITPEGECKLTDFGLFAALLPAKPVTDSRLRNRIGYLSPEQLVGESPTAASDVFSLAAIAYELLTLQKAFSGEGPIEVQQAVLSSQPKDPALPRAVVRVLQRALARSPFERYPDARAFADALDAALRISPLPGTRKDVGDRVAAALRFLLEGAEGSGVVQMPQPNLEAAAFPDFDDMQQDTPVDSTVDKQTFEFVRPEVLPSATLAGVVIPPPRTRGTSAPPVKSPLRAPIRAVSQSQPPVAAAVAPPATTIQGMEPFRVEAGAAVKAQAPTQLPTGPSTRSGVNSNDRTEELMLEADFGTTGEFRELRSRSGDDPALAAIEASIAASPPPRDEIARLPQLPPKSTAAPATSAGLSSQTLAGAGVALMGRSSPAHGVASMSGDRLAATGNVVAPSYPKASAAADESPKSKGGASKWIGRGFAVLGVGSLAALSIWIFSDLDSKKANTGEPVAEKGSAAKGGSSGSDGSAMVVAVAQADAKTDNILAAADANIVATSQPDAALAQVSVDAPLASVDAARATVDAATAVATTVPDAAPVQPAGKANKGELVIETTPAGARVFLDGADQGVTPLKLPASADKHSIAVYLANHELYLAEVDGGTAVNVVLKEVTPPGGPAGIKVRCKERDRYYIFLDGKPTGQLCPSEKIEVDKGEHVIETYDLTTENRRQFPANVTSTDRSLRVRID